MYIHVIVFHIKINIIYIYLFFYFFIFYYHNIIIIRYTCTVKYTDRIITVKYTVYNKNKIYNNINNKQLY